MMKGLLVCLCVVGLPTRPGQLQRVQRDLDSLIATLSSQLEEEDVTLTSEKLGGETPFPDDNKKDDNNEVTIEYNKQITEKMFFDVTVDGKKEGRIVLGMFGHAVPKTISLFRGMVKGEDGKTPLKDSLFHGIYPGFVIKGGELNEKVEDENFVLGHDEPGILSLDNDDNGKGSFFITTAAYPHLNGKHVVFGKVVEGMEIVNKIQHFGSNDGTPNKKVAIQNAGVLWSEDDDAFIGSAKVNGDDAEFHSIDKEESSDEAAPAL